MRDGRGHRSLEGVVLAVRDWADSHRIVEILSAGEGRVSLLARGGRASRRRFAGCLDLFFSLRLQCRSRRDLWSLEAADVLAARLGIRSDLEALARASVLCECARVVAPEHQAAPELYVALTGALDALDAGRHGSAVAAYPAILATAGISPDVRACASCGRRAPPRVALEVSGGVLCDTCAGGRPTVRTELVVSGVPDSAAEATALERAVAARLEAHVGRRLKSLGILGGG